MKIVINLEKDEVTKALALVDYDKVDFGDPCDIAERIEMLIREVIAQHEEDL